jgi:hypothetical protein
VCVCVLLLLLGGGGGGARARRRRRAAAGRRRFGAPAGGGCECLPGRPAAPPRPAHLAEDLDLPLQAVVARRVARLVDHLRGGRRRRARRAPGADGRVGGRGPPAGAFPTAWTRSAAPAAGARGRRPYYRIKQAASSTAGARPSSPGGAHLYGHLLPRDLVATALDHRKACAKGRQKRHRTPRLEKGATGARSGARAPCRRSAPPTPTVSPTS